MTHSRTNKHRASSFTTRTAALFGALIALGLLAAGPASASYEGVGCFAGPLPGLKKSCEPGEKIEETQLGSVSGMAVNSSGAGGVAKGTVYAIIDTPSQGPWVVVYKPEEASEGNPVPEGGLTFVEAWQWSLLPGPTERCGPSLEKHCPPKEGTQPQALGIAIDPANGNVYVLSTAEVHNTGQKVVTEYTAHGEEITRFGEFEQGKPTSESLNKVHSPVTRSASGLAVDGAGNAYLYDENQPDNFYHRLMEFKPCTSGDYTSYCYAGQEHDIAGGFLNANNLPVHPALDNMGHIYTLPGEKYIEEYDLSDPSGPPICSFEFAKGGVYAMAVNPETGEVFFYSYRDKKIHRLAPCSGGTFKETESFLVAPERSEVYAMTFDPVRRIDPTRAPGTLYAGAPSAIPTSGGKGDPNGTPLGYVFAQVPELAPEVLSRAVSNVGQSTASLSAQINPNGPPTNYVFQYLDDAAYEANEPHERQSLRISAGGGVFGLGFEGKQLGGEASATLTAGSKSLTTLHTITATATLSAAKGTGDLNGATGNGTVIKDSEVITSVNPSAGSFEAGQGISGEGIPSESTIVSVTAETGLSTLEVKISNKATESSAHTGLQTGTKDVTGVNASEGSFEVGQQIKGFGISDKTTITAVGAGTLTLSKPASNPQDAVALQAGSNILTSVVAGIGKFKVGERIEGEGIPTQSETTITAVGPGTLTLSNAVEKPGSGVEVFSSRTEPLTAGEQVEGAGIPAGTKITSIEVGKATLSNPATASGTNVLLKAGLPADVSAESLQGALERLPTIGSGNVEVSGGPGDEAGANPYEISFVGDLDNTDLPELSADDSFLSGGPATAVVQTEHQGGGGFDSGFSEAPAGGALLGEGTAAISAATTLTGLAPGTTYHYRVVATSHCSQDDLAKVCEDASTPGAFRTFPTEKVELPDHRAWELVSPADKQGGQVYVADRGVNTCGELECKPAAPYPHPMQSAADGEAVVYGGAPFVQGQGGVAENEYIARRTPSGWQTTNLTPQVLSTGPGYQAFNPTLTQGVMAQFSGQTLSPEAPSGLANLYSQPTGDPGSISSFLAQEPPNRGNIGTGTNEFRLSFAGGSADFSKLFFAANDALTEATPSAPEAVDGGPTKYNLYELSEGQLRLINVLPGNTETSPGSAISKISSDGSRVFWTSASGQLYVREGAETTKEIPDSGKFLSASADGSKVLLSDGHLYDLETETTTDLSEGKGGFQGIAGQSEDLSTIYFVDSAALAPGAEDRECKSATERTQSTQIKEEAEGKTPAGFGCNLYAFHGGATSFIATLQANDNGAATSANPASAADWRVQPVERSAEASPDGRYLAFLSRVSLTGYDSRGPCGLDGGVVVANLCNEAFLYDSATGEVHCVSCNPTGVRPLGAAFLRQIAGTPPPAMPQPRYLTNSGRLYFDSRDSLSPTDTNEGVEDVYQYEPLGIGTCEREAGCVNLISAGTGAVDSNFLSMSEDGRDVFFTTRDQLSLKDKDELFDLYDARENGGIPAESEVARSECQGEACQGVISPPNDPTPGSSSFEGAGNVNEAKAKKHKKAHKKKHAKQKHAHKRAAKHNRGGAK